MNHAKRILSLLLCALLLCASSCGSTGSAGTDSTAGAPADSGTEAPVKAGYPYEKELDLKGKTYTFLNCPQNQWAMQCTLFPDELNGETVNDAMFNRDAAVMSKYSCVLKEHTVDDIANMVSYLGSSVMAGDDDFQAAYLPMYLSASAVSGGWLTCLNDFDELHLDEDWWNQAQLDATSIGHKNFYATSPLHLMSIDGIWCMFFNDDMMDDLGLTYPYQLVRDGKWTLDRFQEYTKAAANLNGDASFALNENGKCVYGCASITTSIAKFIYGLGATYITKDKNDQPVINIESDRFVSALQRLTSYLGTEGEFMIASGGNFAAYPSGVTPYMSLFVENRTLFIATEVKVANTLRSMEHSFGVLPFPKLDEDQENYCSTALHQLVAASIPVTNKDADNTAYLLDVLSYESNEKVLPLFIEMTVEQKGLRNDESIEMMSLVRSTLSYDLGIAYQLVTSLESALSTKMRGGDANVVSSIASEKPGIETKLADLVKQFS